MLKTTKGRTQILSAQVQLSQCLRRVTESVMSVELEAFYSELSWYCLYQEEIF